MVVQISRCSSFLKTLLNSSWAIVSLITLYRQALRGADVYWSIAHCDIFLEFGSFTSCVLSVLTVSFSVVLKVS